MNITSIFKVVPTQLFLVKTVMNTNAGTRDRNKQRSVRSTHRSWWSGYPSLREPLHVHQMIWINAGTLSGLVVSLFKDW